MEQRAKAADNKWLGRMHLLGTAVSLEDFRPSQHPGSARYVTIAKTPNNRQHSPVREVEARGCSDEPDRGCMSATTGVGETRRRE